MGAYPNRYNGHEGRQQSQGVDTRSDVTSRARSLVDAVASSQSAHAIEPITMRVPDACRYIGISRSTLYLLIADGELEIIKLGCSTFVLTESLKALIGRRRAQSKISVARYGD